MAVKGSNHHSMRVIPHRPFRRFLGYIGLLVVFVLGVFVSYYSGIYRTQHVQQITNDGKAEQLQQASSQLTQELTQLRTNAEIDRQTIEEMRQSVITQKAQMAAFERDLRVYKELLSPGTKTNPFGVSFGLFTVFALPEKNHFNYKLVVQKLSAKDADFSGILEFNVIGQQAGKPAQLSLHQISSQVASANIPLEFKYFQTLEGELQLPFDFIPQTIALVVRDGDKKDTRVAEAELEWPVSSI